MEGTPKTLAVIPVVIGVSLIDFRLKILNGVFWGAIQNLKLVSLLLVLYSFHGEKLKL